MKLQNKKRTNLIIVIIVVILVAALVVAGIFIGKSVTESQDDKKNQEIQKIAISIVPRLDYYVGDAFDPTGLKIQVIAGTNDYSYFVEYPNSELLISGFDSSVANDTLPITVTYKGFTATFNVRIKEHEPQAPQLIAIEAKDLKTTYSLERWNKNGPDYNNSYLLCTYSDGSTENVWIQNTWATQREIMDAPGTTFVTIEYMGKSIQVEFTITN